jgi:hypothetical protein
MVSAGYFTKKPITSFIRGGRYETAIQDPKVGTTEGGSDRGHGDLGHASSFFLLSEKRGRHKPATTATNRAGGEVSEGRDGANSEHSAKNIKEKDE